MTNAAIRAVAFDRGVSSAAFSASRVVRATRVTDAATADVAKLNAAKNSVATTRVSSAGGMCCMTTTA